MQSDPDISISWGELFDRISILQLKHSHATDQGIREALSAEINSLQNQYDNAFIRQVQQNVEALAEINQKLWNVEDALRLAEKREEFGPEFVSLARSVYILNDQRSAEKVKINTELKSGLVEYKIFSE